MAFELESSAFASGQLIPVKHTCDGPDLSPPPPLVGFSVKHQELRADHDPDAPGEHVGPLGALCDRHDGAQPARRRGRTGRGRRR
jgi:hypothetical protein